MMAQRRARNRVRGRDFDFLIVGGGIIGATMASLLVSAKAGGTGQGRDRRRSARSRAADASVGGIPIGTCGFLR